ncbi:MAG: LPS assembly lipoprotein LptE [Bacteroidota bacterium]
MSAGAMRWTRWQTWALTSTFLLLTSYFSACGIYSFSGASIPDYIDTVAIPLAVDQSSGGPATMDQDLTDFLFSRFVQQTRLDFVEDEAEADALLLTTIERYTNRPTAVTGDEVAALNSVSISVRAVYTDRVEDIEQLAQSFSFTVEYDPADGLDGETEAAVAVLEQIAEDIFIAAASDW